MAELSMDERIAVLETEVKAIGKQESKIDKLMELVGEVRTSIVGLGIKYTTKDECNLQCTTCDKTFADIKSGQRKVFWAAVAATFTLVVWLLQQVLSIHIKIGG